MPCPGWAPDPVVALRRRAGGAPPDSALESVREGASVSLGGAIDSILLLADCAGGTVATSPPSLQPTAVQLLRVLLGVGTPDAPYDR